MTQTETIKITIKTLRETEWRSRNRKGRLYIDVDDRLLPDEPTVKCTDLECGSAWCETARTIGAPEKCEVDHVEWRKYLRAVRKIYRGFLDEAKFAGDLPATMTVVWSDKAGCSCSCSPGYIIDNAPTLRGTNTWVTVK